MNKAPAEKAGFLGWRMVALGFVAQNIAIGTTFGSYGVLIKPVSEDFDAPRSLVALGIASITLLMGLVSPALGSALDHRSIRAIMGIGAALIGAGFFAASLAGNIYLFLLAFGLLVGLGSAMLGTLPAAKLVSNWFIDNRGTAIGIVSMPLVVAIAPPAVTALIEWFDWRVTLMVLGATGLLLLPFLRLIVNRPADIGQHPYVAAESNTNSSGSDLKADAASAAQWKIGTLLRNAHYWMVVIFGGMVFAGGIVIVTHVFFFATDAGVSSQRAAVLLSINGVFAMAGAILFGWIADRLGPALTLSISAAVQAVFWILLLNSTDFGVMVASMLGIGLCGGGCHPVFTALLAKEFGQSSFGTAMGLAALMMLPLTFSAAPFAGFLFDQNGNYYLAFQIHIGLFVAAAVYFFAISRNRNARHQPG